MERIVVVGASLAGLRTVEALRRLGYDGHLTLVGDERHLPYDRPPLSKACLDTAPSEPEVFRSEADLRTTLDVQLILGNAALRLDTKGRQVRLKDCAVAYDHVVVATGVAARKLPLEVVPAGVRGVHSLRTRDDALAIREALDRGGPVVVIGAGFIGSEVAAAARRRGLSVTIVEREPTPLTRSLGADIGRLIADMHRAAGTDLRCGVAITGVDLDHGRIQAVHLDDGSTLPAELLVVGTGAVPATGWLDGSDVQLHPVDRGVLCGADLAASVPGVFAAGDVAHVPHQLVDGRHLRLEHWTNAAEQATIVARSILGVKSPPAPPTIPYFWSDLYADRVQFVGVPEADETTVLGEGTDAPIALYRRNDLLVGALIVNRPREVMKFRRRIAERTPWTEVLASAYHLIGTDESPMPLSRSIP